MATQIIALPPELIIRILEYLSGVDIGQFSQTCTHFRELCHTDLIWQKLCQNVCSTDILVVEDWEASFYDIYTRVLHRYGTCLGLWRRQLYPYGGLLQVKKEPLNPADDKVYLIQHYVIKFVSDLREVDGFLQVLKFPPPIKIDAGRLIGTEFHPPLVWDIRGPLRPRNVFSIGINTNKTEILCLRGYHGPHPGSLQFDKNGVDVIFTCNKMSCHVHPQGSNVEFEELINEETDNSSVPFTGYDKARLENYISSAQTYLLSSIRIQPTDPRYPIQPGLFLAHYSSHGIEIFLLKYDMEDRQAQMIKVTGDPNVPSGETSIYVNLRKSMSLTEDQQGDMLYMMSLTEDEVPDVEDMELAKQPFVGPSNFEAFLEDSDATTCLYRFSSKGRVAGTGYTNPSFSPGHFCVLSDDVIYNLWLLMHSTFGYYRIKKIN